MAIQQPSFLHNPPQAPTAQDNRKLWEAVQELQRIVATATATIDHIMEVLDES